MGFITIEEQFTRLGLSPTELIVLGLLHGYSQGRQGVFYGTRSYVQKWMGCKSHHTVDKTLRSLVEKGLVAKSEVYENGQLRYAYKVLCDEEGNICPRAENALDPGQKTPSPRAENALNNKIDNKCKNISPYSACEREMEMPFEGREFLEAWEDLLKQPKWKGKTRSALERSLKFLAKHTESDAVKIIDKTIRGGWQGLFELDARDTAGPAGRTTATATAIRASRESFERIAARHDATGMIDEET